MEVKKFSKQEFDTLIEPRYVSSKDGVNVYRYSNQKKDYVIRKYPQELSEEMLQEIYQYGLIPADYPILHPKGIIKIDDKIEAIMIDDFKQYVSIGSVFKTRKERYQLLLHIKEEVVRLMQVGVSFQNLDSDTICFDGQNILFSGILDSILIKSLGYPLNLDMIQELYFDFNIFTISYLYNIPRKLVLKQLEDILVKWFSVKQYRHLTGITDNQECLQYCCDMVFPSEQPWPRLLIDLMEKNKIKQKI